MKKTIECTKEEWDSFVDVKKGTIDITRIYEIAANRFKIPPRLYGGTIALAMSAVSSKTGAASVSLSIHGFGEIELIYTKEPSSQEDISILPKKYRPSYPGSGHFQTKRTKQSRFEGRL